MKLNIDKSTAIELDLLPDTGTQTAHGRQFRVEAGKDTPRANRLINTAVRTYFELPEAPVHAEYTSVAAERAATRAADRIRPAVFKDRDSDLLRVVYKEIAVRFVPKTALKARRQILAKFGLEIRRHGQFDRELNIAHDPSGKVTGERVVEVSNEINQLKEIEFAFPNFVSEFSRSAPPLPSLGQWHLHLRSGGSAKAKADVDIRAAWESTMGSPQIVVAVLDDGVDVDHPNLRDNIVSRPDPSDSRDLLGRDFFIPDNDHPDHFNPRPKRFQYPYDQMTGNDIHGTPCAGVAVASGKVDNVYGAAPSCRILPVKVFHADELASEERIADAIAYAARFADILSCSWSGAKSGIIDAALRDAAKGSPLNKRGEKGTLMFFASGNESAKKVAYPASSPHTIAVGASTDQSVIADYSNAGAELWVCAPSSGGKNGILTTDISSKDRGFNTGVEAKGGADGLHTNEFGGTSSATPLVAGVAALVLSINPDLSLNDAKNVLRDTAEKLGPKNGYKGDPSRNPAYGYGRVHAGAAVAAAARSA